MRYDTSEIEGQLRLGEDSRREFKRIEFKGGKPVSPRRNDLADEMAAFANANGGVLLCSVADDGEALPMSRAQQSALDAMFVEIATDSVKPPLRIETHHGETASGERILVVSIPKGEAQHDSPGGTFLRVGATKRPITSDERLRLAQRRGQARFLWFDEQPVPNTGFGTLDESLWKPLLDDESSADPETALEKMTLLASDDAGVLRATVAGILICTRSPEQHLSNACITATRYQGHDRASGQADAQLITGPLDQQIAGAVAFAVRNMGVSAEKMPARAELPQYSDEAVFEAVVNAVAHRDYSVRGSRIRLSMFADRLEIQSPGSLPNNLTLENIAKRQATRNEALASALGRMFVKGIRGSRDRLFFMERRGSGVPTIRRETYQLSGKYPEYELINDSEVRLIIPGAAQESSAARSKITAYSGGQPLPGVNLLLLFPNKTWNQSVTDAEGEAAINLHTTHLPMTVFAAAPGYAAGVYREWLPATGALMVELQELPKGGSDIFPEATGHLPGLKGRLNPKRDPHGRAYLYASNVAINKGREQPVSFILGEELQLTDADGYELWVRIVDIAGRSALVEYSTAARPG